VAGIGGFDRGRLGALALIWTAIDQLQEFPNLDMPTGDADILQIVVRFGASGYVVRYATRNSARP
jgi:hypothetical protein